MSENELIGAIGSMILIVIMFLGIPIWLCMILVGAVGYDALKAAIAEARAAKTAR